MIKLFYFEVPNEQDAKQLADEIHLLFPHRHFVHQDPVPGDLDEVIELIRETNAFSNMTTKRV